MRNRPDNWSTKRLTKTTWTGLRTIAMQFVLGVAQKCIPTVGVSPRTSKGSLLTHGPLLLDRLVNQNPFRHPRYVA